MSPSAPFDRPGAECSGRSEHGEKDADSQNTTHGFRVKFHDPVDGHDVGCLSACDRYSRLDRLFWQVPHRRRQESEPTPRQRFAKQLCESSYLSFHPMTRGAARVYCTGKYWMIKKFIPLCSIFCQHVFRPPRNSHTTLDRRIISRPVRKTRWRCT